MANSCIIHLSNAIMARKTMPLRPATEHEKAYSNGFLAAMPHCGEMSKHVRLVECSEMPEINQRGGRDVEGWECVFEADVQHGKCEVTLWAKNRMAQRRWWSTRCSSRLACRHVHWLSIPPAPD